MQSRLTLGALLAMGCSCGGPASPPLVEPAVPGPTASAPTYEVHEWGLVRGTLDDRVMLSGPHAAERVMVVTKPVLYFHRHGEGALVVDVEARMPHGHIVESWPSMGGAPGTFVAWHGVVIQGDACPGSHYPTLAEDPCPALTDGCEAATLAGVETTDSSCLYWPQPPGGDGPTRAWNHLFYRGEISGAPPLPLHAQQLPDGGLRLTATGSSPIPGHVLRVRRANGAPGFTDGLAIAAPPVPGQSIVIPAPSGPIAEGGESLGASLREAGLTRDEVDAFRRAWDDTLFGNDPTASSGVTTRSVVTATTTPPLPPTSTTSILYVVPASAADDLAVLTFSPPPTTVRRAIVVWLDETEAP